MNGTNTMIKFVPSEDIAVVVLINTASDLRQKLPNDIIGSCCPITAPSGRLSGTSLPSGAFPLSLQPS